MDGLYLQSPLRTISVLVFHLLLTHFCRGESQLIGPPQPIVARVGDDIILPCHLEPAMDVVARTLEWTTSDLDVDVHVRRSGQEKQKSPSYEGRTSLFIEELKHGNISLKLSKVKMSDKGIYSCYIHELRKRSFVELVVASDAVSSPVISLAGVDRDRGGVMLQCESGGWYPEPEVFWLDGEGNLLSAGPTETVRGPDDLYNVSSRVTVEKRHRNNITCRVQQNDINQTRETHIIVNPDGFFKVLLSSFTVTTGLAVSLALCIVLIVAAAVFFFWWKWRPDPWDETDGRDRDTAQSEGDEGAATRSLISPIEAKQTEIKKLQDENKKLQKDRDTKINQIKDLQDEVNKLQDEKQNLQKDLDTKKNELEEQVRNEEQKRINAETEVETLKEDLEKKNKEIKDLQDEVSELQNEKQNLQKDLDTKKNELEASEQKVAELQKQNSYTTIQRSVRGDVFVRDFHPNGEYVSLKSNEEQQLKGWELQIRVNDGEPIIYRFDNYKLKPGKTITIRAQDSIPLHRNLIDFVGWNKISWGPKDRVQVRLFNCSGEEMAMSSYDPQHRQQT